MERHPRHLLPQKAGGGESAQLVDDSDNAKAAVFVEPNRPGSSLCTQGRTRLNKEERESRKEEKVGLTHSLRSGFLFPSSSPRTPSSLLSFPYADAQGIPVRLLRQTAQIFTRKFTVAVPMGNKSRNMGEIRGLSP